MTTPAAPDPSVRMSAPGAAGRRGRTRTRTRSGRFLELDFQAKALELLDEHVEGLRRAGLGRVLALDERVDGPAVVQLGLAVLGQSGRAQLGLDYVDRGAGEHRRRAGVALLVRGPAQVHLEDLADVHARGHAVWVQDDLHHLAVREVRQVLLGHDARDDALVAVAPGHLVADRQLAALGDVDLHQLDHARRQLVAARDLFDLLLELLLAAGERVLSVVHGLPEPLVHALVLGHGRAPGEV